MGLAKRKQEITGTVCGTKPYMAPEVLEGEDYDTKADIYSFGLVMWEMWYGKLVFSELSQAVFLRRIRKGECQPHTPTSDGKFNPNPPPAQWTELMTSCWQAEPRQRKTAAECISCIKSKT